MSTRSSDYRIECTYESSMTRMHFGPARARNRPASERMRDVRPVQETIASARGDAPAPSTDRARGGSKAVRRHRLEGGLRHKLVGGGDRERVLHGEAEGCGRSWASGPTRRSPL